MTSTGQATPAGMTTPLSGNTPQDRAIVITDGENISLRRPIAQQPPIMVSNNELLRELHYLRRQSTDYQKLKDREGQIESSLPRTRLSRKQPLEEGSRRRDEIGHVITPRNLFPSYGQITVGGDDRRLENTKDSGRPPHQEDRPPLILTGRST